MERLQKKRVYSRDSITRLLKRIEKELQDKQEQVDPLEELLGELNRKEVELYQLDADLELLLDDADLEKEFAEVEKHKDEINLWKIRLERQIRKLNEDRSSESSEKSYKGKPFFGVQTIKLPRLSIQTFHGDSANWQAFWAQFETSIHTNEVLTKVDKFNYLKSFLGGIAANSIAGLAPSDKNYDAAIKLLEERFGRRDLIISAHMSNLLSLSPVKNSTDITALRNIYDACEIQIRSLESLGVISATYSALLCPIFMRVIPKDIVLEFNRKHERGENWEIKELLTLFRNEIESRERTQQMTKAIETLSTGEKAETAKKAHHNKFKKEKGSQNKQEISSATALNSVTENTCLFCQKSDHETTNCQNKSVDDKRAVLKKDRRCFLCFKVNHPARWCWTRGRCSQCNGRHHKSLCDEPKKENPVKENLAKSATVLASLFPNENSRPTIFLQTALVLAKGNQTSSLVRCLIDSGSQRSFIREKIARDLNLKDVGTETLKIHSFGKNEPVNAKRRRLKIKLKNRTSPNDSIDLEVLEVPEICGAAMQFPCEEIIARSSDLGIHLADSPLNNPEIHSEIDIIIGADYYWRVLTGKVKRLSESLVSVETIFGWTLHGPTSAAAMTVCETVVIAKTCVETEEELVSTQLKKFWELDAIGITDKSERDHLEQQELTEMFESNIEQENGRYRVSLPWKLDKQGFLADNREIAERRLESLNNRFRKDPLFFKRYEAVILEYLDKGIMEPVPLCTKGESRNPVFYLPHRAVIREDRATTKLRIVFDASSCKRNELSLNDCLHPGPNLNPDLFDLLIKFRENEVAFTADIEKAFLQVELAEKDRDVARLLWTKNPFAPEHLKEVIELRLTRVLFGINSSPFLLASTIKYHLKEKEIQYPDTCKLLNETLYVDDLIGGAKDAPTALDRSIECVKILKDANMHMGRWQTNSKELQKNWECSSVIETGEFMETFNEEMQSIKVLGISWNKAGDNFFFDVSRLLTFLLKSRNTKRFVLQAAGRVFDPVGFLSPYTVRVKILFQELWQEGVGWDESLPEGTRLKWDSWCGELRELNKVKIPRYYLKFPQHDQSLYELHCFSDASLKAYGAVVYLRTVVKSDEIDTCFLSSKSRVAPLSKITLPRLELMGALLAARLSRKIKSCLKYTVREYFWTDSSIVYYWIRGSARRFKPFVEHRVSEIQGLTNPSTWSHCPGKENPADLVSRGTTVSELIDNPLWWNGPYWLKLEPQFWPNSELQTPKDDSLELRSKVQEAVLLKCTVKTDDDRIIDVGKFSSLQRIIRVVGWVKRFVFNLRNKIGKEGVLSVNELCEAREYLILKTQREFFGNEIYTLENASAISKDSKIHDLRPFLDEKGILRVGGRLEFSDLPREQKHPILLPREAKLTELICETEHKNVMHSGVAATLARIRKTCWIPKGRQAVKKVINKCLICRKYSAMPATQITAPLPKDRLLETPPFSVTGVDFAGPIYCKGKNKSAEKAFIALFTCAVTRAIHLELVSDLTTDSFLLALRRFLARRGNCHTIYSDNAKTFKRAEKELKEMYNILSDPNCQNYLGCRGISWKYIVERAAFWGGFWERLVRSVKTCLKKVLGRALLSFEELSTLLSEVEAVINSRPLTFTYNEHSEPEALTPAHFLVVGNSVLSMPENSQISAASSKEQLTRRLNYRKRLLKSLWTKWRTQYLLELRSGHYFSKPIKGPELKQGDVVLIDDVSKSKLLWKLGIVQDVYPGRDGKIRACGVRTEKGTIIRRPVQLLYPLEVKDEN